MTFKSIKLVKAHKIDVEKKEHCLHLSLGSLFKTRLPHNLESKKTVKAKYQSKETCNTNNRAH